MKVLILAMLAILFSDAWADEKAKPELEFEAVGRVQIDPTGHVGDYKLQNQLPAAIASLVDRSVRRWTFDPILAEGKAVTASTSLHVHLHAVPDATGANYTVKVENVFFGEPRALDNRPPKYPKEAVSAHLTAKVIVCLHLDEKGDVAEVQPYQTSLGARAGSEIEAERWRKVFETASVRAAKSWHYDLAETINGKPVGNTVLVPIVFNLHIVGEEDHPNAWKAFLPGPIHPAPWTQAKLADNTDLSNLREGSAQPLDSRFHLHDDVIGKAL